jgi:hypothetical protein
MTDLPFWKPPPPTQKDLRQFGGLFTVLAAALTAYFAWRSPEVLRVPAAIAATLLFLTLVVPRALTPAWWPWMVLVRVLGFVNSHLLLGLVFFVLFTPLGLILRVLGRDPLERDFTGARRIAREGGSLWQPRDKPQLANDHYRHQF